MDGPTKEQVLEAIRIIDEHLDTCTEDADSCLGVDDQLRAIHPDLVAMAQPDYPPDPEPEEEPGV
jgi:hypothetical protein